VCFFLLHFFSFSIDPFFLDNDEFVFCVQAANMPWLLLRLDSAEAKRTAVRNLKSKSITDGVLPPPLVTAPTPQTILDHNDQMDTETEHTVTEGDYVMMGGSGDLTFPRVEMDDEDDDGEDDQSHDFDLEDDNEGYFNSAPAPAPLSSTAIRLNSGLRIPSLLPFNKPKLTREGSGRSRAGPLSPVTSMMPQSSTGAAGSFNARVSPKGKKGNHESMAAAAALAAAAAMSPRNNKTPVPLFPSTLKTSPSPPIISFETPVPSNVGNAGNVHRSMPNSFRQLENLQELHSKHLSFNGPQEPPPSPLPPPSPTSSQMPSRYVDVDPVPMIESEDADQEINLVRANNPNSVHMPLTELNLQAPMTSILVQSSAAHASVQSTSSYLLAPVPWTSVDPSLSDNQHHPGNSLALPTHDKMRARFSPHVAVAPSPQLARLGECVRLKQFVFFCFFYIGLISDLV
jgi:hypothetical protein